MTLAPSPPDTIRFAPGALAKLGYHLARVEAAPPSKPLKLAGSLILDANSLIPVRPLFAGEVVEIGTLDKDASRNPKRTLQYGDRVQKGQLLAVIWSKEVGEKKSELVDAISKLETDRQVLDRYERAEKGALAQQEIDEARRAYEADVVAVEKAKRTLLSWRLSEREIDAVYGEAQRLRKRESADVTTDKNWANTEVRASVDGVILEKNVNVGTRVDPSQDLFKIADTRRVRVAAKVYEEDLPTLRNLPPEKRRWKIDLKSDPFDEPISGDFELIGSIIDPAEHAATVMGTLDNADGNLYVGQFVTATIDLDPDPALVAVPATAVVDDGGAMAVFVAVPGSPDDFTRRRVAIAGHTDGKVCIRSEPTSAERAAGAQPLAPGEWVITGGVIELNAEFAVLKAMQPEIQAKVNIP